jgi:hypothetical protein
LCRALTQELENDVKSLSDELNIKSKRLKSMQDELAAIQQA